MVSDYSAVTFGNLTLEPDIIKPKKVPHTIKQVTGGKLLLRESPGTSLRDQSLVIQGTLRGSTRTTERETLEGFDDLIAHTFVDGIHDGEYFVTTGGLEFNDDANRPTTLKYTLVLIQDQ